MDVNKERAGALPPVLSGLLSSPLLPALLLAPLYLWGLPPGLPPYRDAGELSFAAMTLGIPHQPGYPLYVLSSKLFSLLPLGNPAWRLNLFSALAGLGAVTVFWNMARRLFTPWPALAASLALGVGFTFRTISSVPEMYALNVLFACLLLAVALPRDGDSPGTMHLAAFLLGFGMTNRMDLLLAAPAVLILLWPRIRAAGPGGFLKSCGFALLGFSLYLFLPVRSSGNPLLDWSHPADWDTFIAVITRRSYGSTLDLISSNYAPGELFLPNLWHYALHLWETYNALLLVAGAGLLLEWRFARLRCAGILALFAFTGPVFLYLGNMPPNPHALAIVEPYYLLPNLAVAFWVAAGLWHLSPLFPRAAGPLALAAAAAVALAAHGGAGASRRSLFAAEDYASDVLRSLPPSATVVAKKDVQLFSLWYLQLAENLRPDVKVVAQGLSGAPWYRRSAALYRPGLRLYSLNGAGEAEWRAFAGDNAPAFATLDAEVPRGLSTRPAGLLTELLPVGGVRPSPLSAYSLFRLRTNYHDFFDKDLGASYAQGLLYWSTVYPQAGDELLSLAGLLDPDMPDVSLYRGIRLSGRGDWAGAAAAFLQSAKVYARLLELAKEYHSLPALREGLLSSGAYAWLNYGVALEKSGDARGAEAAYLRALEYNPSLAEAHYNTAILYWGKDWARVRRELSETLRLNPSHAAAAAYLAKLAGR